MSIEFSDVIEVDRDTGWCFSVLVLESPCSDHYLTSPELHPNFCTSEVNGMKSRILQLDNSCVTRDTFKVCSAVILQDKD